MNKFTKLIASNGDSVLVKRAETIAKNAKISQENLINRLLEEKNNKELELDRITDLAPKDKNSLVAVDSDWNPKEWVTKVQNIKQDLYSLDIQLKIARETFDEFFKELPE